MTEKWPSFPTINPNLAWAHRVWAATESVSNLTWLISGSFAVLTSEIRNNPRREKRASYATDLCNFGAPRCIKKTFGLWSGRWGTNEAVPHSPLAKTSDATLDPKRIKNLRPGTHFGVRRGAVDTFAIHAVLGHISGIFIDVINLRLFTSFTVDYSWKKCFAPRINPVYARVLGKPNLGILSSY